MKVMAFNEPKFVIFLAVFCVACSGTSQPLFGWIFAKMLMVISMPTLQMNYLECTENQRCEEDAWKERLEDNVIELCIYMLVLTCIMFIGYLGKSYLFSYLGENVTLQVRQLLYKAILEKNIGWFDEQENQSSVLTSAMAQETALINGASSEALGPYTEACFALFGGIIIGFYFCWQESLITLGCVPFIIVGNYIGVEFEKGLGGATGENEKKANLLIGDAINNFKTVQSFGYEHLIVQSYRDLVHPIYKASICKHIKAGIAFGFS